MTRMRLLFHLAHESRRMTRTHLSRQRLTFEQLEDRQMLSVAYAFETAGGVGGTFSYNPSTPGTVLHPGVVQYLGAAESFAASGPNVSYSFGSLDSSSYVQVVNNTNDPEEPPIDSFQLAVRTHDDIGGLVAYISLDSTDLSTLSSTAIPTTLELSRFDRSRYFLIRDRTGDYIEDTITKLTRLDFAAVPNDASKLNPLPNDGGFTFTYRVDNPGGLPVDDTTIDFHWKSGTSRELAYRFQISDEGLDKDGNPLKADGTHTVVVTHSELLAFGRAVPPYPISDSPTLMMTIDPPDEEHPRGKVRENDEENNVLLIPSIYGQKFHDRNGDGMNQEEEESLAEWTIQLRDGQGAVIGTRVTARDDSSTSTTDETGNFWFLGLASGTFSVTEVSQEGWVPTFPEGTQSHSVTIHGGQNPELVNVGNFDTVALSGQKFEDRNGDGQKGEEESGLEGWTIQLDLDNDGTVDRTATTDAEGKYHLDDVGPGTHSVTEAPTKGWRLTFPEAGTHLVTPSSDVDVEDLDFGNFKFVTLAGHTFADLNGDGSKGDGENGPEGWTIALDLDSDGTIDRTTTTDADGKYSFNDVGPGTHTIAEVVQSGWVQTFPATESHVVTTESGQDRDDLDFGNLIAADLIAVANSPADSLAFRWNTVADGGGFTFTYQVDNTRGAFIADTTIEFYWQSALGTDAAYTFQINDTGRDRDNRPLKSNGTHTVVVTHGQWLASERALPPPLSQSPSLIMFVDPADLERPQGRVTETHENNNIASLRVVPLVVNVATHGFNPDPRSSGRPAFLAPWDLLGANLEAMPDPFSILVNRVRSYVPRWDSTTSFIQGFGFLMLSYLRDAQSELLREAGHFRRAAVEARLAQFLRDRAAGTAEKSDQILLEAANRIFFYLTSFDANLLLPPAESNRLQRIEFIGHSRGAALNAQLAALLSAFGYRNIEFVGLDGYAADWSSQAPFGGLLSRLEVTAVPGTVSNKINYRAGQGLQHDPYVLASLPTFLAGAPLARLQATHDLRAPVRPGFLNEDLPGANGTMTHHTTITPRYIELLKDSRYYSKLYLGQNRSAGVPPALAEPQTTSLSDDSATVAPLMLGHVAAGGQEADPKSASDSLGVTMIEPVQIDVKPGGNHNPINLASKGTIALSIHTTAEFDASRVDSSSVRFSGAPAAHWSRKEIDRDRDLDMVPRFRMRETSVRQRSGENAILVSNREKPKAALTPQTVDGVFFEGLDDLDLFLSGKVPGTLLDELAASGTI